MTLKTLEGFQRIFVSPDHFFDMLIQGFLTEPVGNVAHVAESGREMSFEDISPDVADFSAAHRLDKTGLRPGAA